MPNILTSTVALPCVGITSNGSQQVSTENVLYGLHKRGNTQLYLVLVQVLGTGVHLKAPTTAVTMHIPTVALEDTPFLP